MDSAIQTRELRKVYTSAPPAGAGRGDTSAGRNKRSKEPKPQIVALDGIDFDVSAGQIFGLLGPNGAGKSTTVGILTTCVRPTSGTAWIGPHDVWREQTAAKRLIGVVAQRPNLDFSLTAREILLFHGAYFGLNTHERNERAKALLDRFKLTDRADQLVRGFSGGMMQRMSIARAMMHDPQVLFLDEPSVGLDPQTRLLLWEIIREYNQKGRTILLTTHNMEEADALCQHLAIIDHGLALLARDARVARRNMVPLMLQTFLQPLLFVFVFGRVMVGSGYMPPPTRVFCFPASWPFPWSSPECGRLPCR